MMFQLNSAHLLPLATAVLLVAQGILPAQSIDTNSITPNQIDQRLKPLIEDHAGQVGTAVRILNSQNQVVCEWSFRGSEVMPTASLIKLPVMIEAYRQAADGKFSMSDMLVLRESDKVPGSGILTEHFSAGMCLSTEDAIRLMIRYSDNTATNLVLDRIGLNATANTMKTMGHPETQIHAKVFRRDTSIDIERSKKFGLGSTTALDMISLLTQMARHELVSPDACDAMIAHLLSCDDSSKFKQLLPPGTKVAHKTGAVTRSRTSAGIIYVGSAKILLCLLTDQNEDTSWEDENEAHVLCAKVSKELYDLLDGKQVAGESVTKALAQGSHGELVEALQRTLNDRVKSELSIDGDFGSATAAVVKKFQRARGLQANAIVDAATWKELGTLITEDEPVPTPDEINTRNLPKSGTLQLDAPPETTAKSWAILDVPSGRILASKQGNEQRPNASTTKLMVAYLVLEQADKDASILDETITFSKRADDTIGSTAGVRAGETLPVRELLYGLLLPSGNDASVALAEHFGSRLADYKAGKSYTDGPAASYELFIAAMNSKAHELELKDTYFMNPHGLTEEGHYSSADDLAKLGNAALRLPHFKDYVSTRERGCRLKSIDGYTRDVLWCNTNHLLEQEGFWGMKTGTTTAAGACLVAFGEHAGLQRIVVLLGSSNSDARYVDARNLFRWTWQRKPDQ